MIDFYSIFCLFFCHKYYITKLFVTATRLNVTNRSVFLDICLSGWLCGTRLIYWISILYLDTSYNPPTKGGYLLFHMFYTYFLGIFLVVTYSYSRSVSLILATPEPPFELFQKFLCFGTLRLPSFIL